MGVEHLAYFLPGEVRHLQELLAVDFEKIFSLFFGFREEIGEDGFELGVHGDAEIFLMIQYGVAHSILDLLESWWAVVRGVFGGVVIGYVFEQGLARDAGDVMEVFDEGPEWFWSWGHLGVV